MSHFMRVLRGLFLCAVFSAAWFGAVRSSEAVDLVPFGSSWKYLQPQGIENDPFLFAGPLFDFEWFLPTYDDTAPVGFMTWEGPSPAPFAYGGIDAFTSVGTTLLTPALPDGDPPLFGGRFTSYYRHEFVTAGPVDDLFLEFLADDGAIVYLDGFEVYRERCCEAGPNIDPMQGDVDTYVNFATTEEGTESAFVTVPLVGGLAPGTHMLAVSVHQGGASTPDAGFEMRLFTNPPPLVGDTNNDGVVDLEDLNNVRNNFGAAGMGVTGDTNDDDIVDLEDLNNVRNNFGAMAAAAVPEPSTISLAMLAFGAALVMCWRRRSH